MIKAIKLKNCATYSSVGASIENCQKVNSFYGPNGSGKSTISNFLYNPTGVQYLECDKWLKLMVTGTINLEKQFVIWMRYYLLD